MMKRFLAGALALVFLLTTGCGADAPSSQATRSDGSSSSSASAAAGLGDLDDGIDTAFSDRDLDGSYDESTAAKIMLNGTQISVEGDGVSASGTIATISAGGTYLISGSCSDGQIVVDASDTDKIQIVLCGASIHCEDHAALFVKGADKVFITLAEGSDNVLSGGEAYALSGDDANVDGVIFSRADLTLNGSGALTVNAAYQHAVVSKDDLVITGGAYQITAAGGGLYGKDCVKIAAGDFTLDTGTDGIQSSNAEEEGRGYVYIAGGTYRMTAGTDAVQAETVLRVDGGDFTLVTGGGSANASVDTQGGANEAWGRWGPQAQAGGTAAVDSAADASGSAKGLKAGTALIVRGGAFAIDSSDDALHSNGTVHIYDGSFTIASGDDGMHADGALVIDGGNVGITKSYEGIEGLSVTVGGGEIQVTASDDGINAAGGSDTGMQGRPGQDSFSAADDADVYLKVTGGVVRIDAAGDGLDANGSFYMEGGTVYVDGPENSGNGALDYDGTAQITGGTIVAVGMSGMAQGFSDSSTQCSILHNFSSVLSAGETVTLTDAQGDTVLSYTPSKSYNSVVISSPKLSQGGSYTLAAGSQSEALTLSSVVTSNGGGGMMAGGREGGRGGTPPEGMAGAPDDAGGQRPDESQPQA